MTYFANSKIYSRTSLTCLAKVFLRKYEKKNEQRKNNLRMAWAPSSDSIILLDKTLNFLSLICTHTYIHIHQACTHLHTVMKKEEILRIICQDKAVETFTFLSRCHLHLVLIMSEVQKCLEGTLIENVNEQSISLLYLQECQQLLRRLWNKAIEKKMKNA